MTDLPKLEAEALERVAKAIYCNTRRKQLPWPRIFSWGEYKYKEVFYQDAKSAITAYKAHIAQALNEENMVEQTARALAIHDGARGLDADVWDNSTNPRTKIKRWHLWKSQAQAALRACPYKQIICGDGE